MLRRTFAEYVVPRPQARWTDAVTTLRHFALVTYTIDPGALSRQLPPRLTPLTIVVDDAPRALLSIVVFMNEDFRSAVLPSPALDMAQINYRAYVIDQQTGDHAIWFLGTLLDGWAFLAPRLLWKMPWRKAAIELRYNYNVRSSLYESYQVAAYDGRESALVQLSQQVGRFQSGAESLSKSETRIEPDPVSGLELPGFPDLETGLVCLTQVSNGFFRRTDGKVGLSQVWHKRIAVRPARLHRATFPLLERLRLVPSSEQQKPYSVLIAPKIEFLSLLPPQVI